MPNHTHSGYATTTQLGNYLAKSGGTITTDSIAGFNIYRNNGVYSTVHFYNTQNDTMTDVGYLGASADGKPVYINSGGSVYDLIHSNNISTQSVASATKATQDSDGNAINTTYLKKSGGALSGNLYIDGDWTTDIGIYFREGSDDKYGFNFTYGDGDYFRLNTRGGSTTNTEVFKVYRGSTSVIFASTPYVGSNKVSLEGHTHSYLPLSGGTLTSAGVTTLNLVDTARNESGISYAGNGGAQWFVGKGVGVSGGGEHFGFYNGTKGLVANFDINGNFTATKFVGPLQGNADSATTAGTANEAVRLLSPYTYEHNTTINTTTTPETLFPHSYTFSAMMKSDSSLFGANEYANVLNFSGYQKYGATQFAVKYNRGTDAAIRAYVQGLGWSPWKFLAFTSDIPNKVSQLTNDSGYTTATGHTHTQLPELHINKSYFSLSNSGTFWIGVDTADGQLYRTNNGWTASYRILDSYNYTGYCASTGHTHAYLPLSGGTVTGTTTFNEEVKMIRSGSSSDICFGIACDFKSNRSQISNLITNYIYLGKDSTDKNIRFRSYSSISSYAPASSIDLLVISSSGCTASNFITTSDRRLKTNIKPLPTNSKSLELNFYEFDYVNNNNHSAGHIAQEVKEVLPEFVHGNESETEHLSIDYTGLHSVQIAALIDEVKNLREENQKLKNDLDKIKSFLNIS